VPGLVKEIIIVMLALGQSPDILLEPCSYGHNCLRPAGLAIYVYIQLKTFLPS